MARFLRGICPVCLLGAELCALSDGASVVDCDGCGEFVLSRSAELCLEDYPVPFDREKLSETMFDVCRMAEPGRPLIDSVAARTLVAMSAP